MMLSPMTLPPMSRTAQYKKITKPLLERKRRARINKCLDELKELMVGALEAEGENINKLEKADILELTVQHLHRLHRLSSRNPMDEAQRYQQGFGQCATEAFQFLLSCPGVDVHMGRNLVEHLRRHLTVAPASPVPLTLKIPNNTCSPPVSPDGFIPRPGSERPGSGEYLNCSPSVEDLTKPSRLLMPVRTSVGSLSPGLNGSGPSPSSDPGPGRGLSGPGRGLSGPGQGERDNQSTKTTLRNVILKRVQRGPERMDVSEGPGRSGGDLGPEVFKKPLSKGRFGKVKVELTCQEEDDEVIDVDSVDDMWRPW